MNVPPKQARPPQNTDESTSRTLRKNSFVIPIRNLNLAMLSEVSTYKQIIVYLNTNRSFLSVSA